MMGKGSAVLGTITLILALVGLGLGGYSWMTLSSVETQVNAQNSWYKYHAAAFTCDPTYSYLTFTSLVIEFELGLNEDVYFSFTSRAHTEVLPGMWSRIIVNFRVDGLFQSDPSAEVGTYDGDFTMSFMIHLQAVREDLSPGTHNVTVVIYGESTANYIWKSTLFVQKIHA